MYAWSNKLQMWTKIIKMKFMWPGIWCILWISSECTVKIRNQQHVTVQNLLQFLAQQTMNLSFCFAAIVELLNVTVGDSSATIQLQNDNFTSNFTITYWLCSEDSRITESFESPVVHLENLTANTTYCYSITYNGNNSVATVCSGTFTTETTPTTQPTTSDGNYSDI